MTSPQKENGYTAIANEVLEELIKLRIPASEKDILYFLLRKTYGYQKKEDRISLTQFEKGTLLSRPTVVKGLKNLLSRNILVKVGLLFSFNKHYDLWVVNTPLLVKYENTTSKLTLTKNGKHTLTHKRKKKMTKEIEGINPQEVSELIKSFELINPACKKMYGNKTQRQACEDLITIYGFDRVKIIIEKTLPKTNQIKYIPHIDTPLQLFNKFSALGDGILKLKKEQENIKSKNKVAF